MKREKAKNKYNSYTFWGKESILGVAYLLVR